MLEVNPDAAADPNFVFNEARLFVIAATQHIVYSEELPALLGKFAYDSVPGLKLSKKIIPLNDNRPSPRIFNEFAAAAFRYASSS